MEDRNNKTSRRSVCTLYFKMYCSASFNQQHQSRHCTHIPKQPEDMMYEVLCFHFCLEAEKEYKNIPRIYMDSASSDSGVVFPDKPRPTHTHTTKIVFTR